MKIVIDDQAFVVGLSELFRQQMKRYETTHLLPLAESVCAYLGLSPAAAPVEGYYTESAELEKFFQLIRTLQDAEIREIFPGPTDAICRLRNVLNSPAMGRVESDDRLLSRSTSPFGEALQILSSWSIEGLCEQAQQLVTRNDSGLLAVAAATGDPVALCVARESMALMADVELAEMQLPEFVWEVSAHVAEVADRFVSNLAKTTGIVLPTPAATSSYAYGQAFKEAELVGRCILVGEQFGKPYPYYHWHIDLHDGRPKVKDFWSSSVWTTAMLRNEPFDERPAMGAQVGAPGLGNDDSIKPSLIPRAGDRRQPVRRGWFARLFQRRR